MCKCDSVWIPESCCIDGIVRRINLGRNKHDVTDGLGVNCTACHWSSHRLHVRQCAGLLQTQCLQLTGTSFPQTSGASKPSHQPLPAHRELTHYKIITLKSCLLEVVEMDEWDFRSKDRWSSCRTKKLHTVSGPEQSSHAFVSVCQRLSSPHKSLTPTKSLYSEIPQAVSVHAVVPHEVRRCDINTDGLCQYPLEPRPQRRCVSACHTGVRAGLCATEDILAETTVCWDTLNSQVFQTQRVNTWQHGDPLLSLY